MASDMNPSCDGAHVWTRAEQDHYSRLMAVAGWQWTRPAWVDTVPAHAASITIDAGVLASALAQSGVVLDVVTP